MHFYLLENVRKYTFLYTCVQVNYVDASVQFYLSRKLHSGFDWVLNLEEVVLK